MTEGLLPRPLPALDALRLVLLDRDGVLNVNLPGSVRRLDELVVLDPAPGAVGRLKAAGLPIAVVTNQSVIGRGHVTWELLGTIHQALEAELEKQGGRIDRFYVAPDTPDAATERRKPGPGMLLEALSDFAVRPEAAVMVGDTVTDAEAAFRAGVAFILVRTGHGAEAQGVLPPGRAVAVVDHVGEAVDLILDA